MAFILFDDWLYMDGQEHAGSYGRDEFERNWMSKIKKVSVAFIDCETKWLSIPGSDVTQKDALVRAAFTEEELIHEERISNDDYQVIAAKKKKIEDIYRYFKNIPVEAVIPYPVGVRAYLKAQGLLNSEQIIIFVDDLKTQAIITIFDEMLFTSPRRISMRDLSYMAGEIKRSILGLSSLRAQKKQKEFIFVSNNKEWLEAFVRLELSTLKNTVHIDCAYPVLEGLKTARFATHFILPQELARIKRIQIRQNHIKDAVCVIGSIVLGGVVYVLAHGYEQDARFKITEANARKSVAIGILIKVNQSKFKSIRSQEVNLRFTRVYFDFYSSLPPHYVIKDFSLDRQGQFWQIKASIIPKSDLPHQADFIGKGIFKDARLSISSNQNQLGIEIEAKINTERGSS